MKISQKIKNLAQAVPRPLGYILGLFITTRLVLITIGLVSRTLLHLYGNQSGRWQFSSHLWLDLWGIWDSGLYTWIASRGYPDVSPLEPVPFFYGFFPFYPLTLRVAGFLLRVPTQDLEGFFHVGVIVSCLSLILCGFFLFKLLRLDEDEPTALRSIKYLFVFPSAMFLSSVYPEVLLLLLIILTFYSARKQRWWLAGVFGFCASLTRPEGCLLVFPS